MKKTDIQKYQEMAPAALKAELSALRHTLTESKLKLHSGQLKDTSVFMKTRTAINFIFNLLSRHESQG
jgi:ribosomal protein L29